MKSPALLSRRMISFVAAMLAVAVFCGGCTSVQSVSGSGRTDIAAIVKPGDRVDCVLRDGTPLRFTVTKVEPGALFAQERRIATADIAHLKVRRISTGKTLLLVGGLVACGLLVDGLSNIAFFPPTGD